MALRLDVECPVDPTSRVYEAPSKGHLETLYTKRKDEIVVLSLLFGQVLHSAGNRMVQVGVARSRWPCMQ